MTPQQFWLILGAFVGLIVVWFAAARIYLWTVKRNNLNAAAVAAEPDPDDLDVKWAAHWHEKDLEYRGSPLWAWLHEDEAAIGQLVDEVFAAALDRTQEMVAVRAAIVVDRGVKPFGFAGVVDMYAQWVHARRRSVRRMVAVLDKAATWPPEWQRQLDVLLAEGAVARGRDKVASR